MNKLALGVSAAILLLAGVLFGSTYHKFSTGPVVLGAVGSYPTHLPQTATRMDSDVYVSGNFENGGRSYFDGNVNVSGTLALSGTFSGGAATYSSLTVTGATALNGGLTMDTNKFVVTDATGNVSASGTASFATTTVRNGLTVGDGTHGLILSGASGANLGSGSIAGTGNWQSFGRFDAYAGVFLNETSGYTMIGTSTAPTADLQVLNRVGANGTSTTVKIGKTGGTGCLAMPASNGTMFYSYPTTSAAFQYRVTTTTRPSFCKP